MFRGSILFGRSYGGYNGITVVSGGCSEEAACVAESIPWGETSLCDGDGVSVDFDVVAGREYNFLVWGAINVGPLGFFEL